MLYKIGSTGTEIGIIQNNLKLLGYDPLGIDCEFGKNTRNAVKEFQKTKSMLITNDLSTQYNQILSSFFQNIRTK